MIREISGFFFLMVFLSAGLGCGTSKKADVSGSPSGINEGVIPVATTAGQSDNVVTDAVAGAVDSAVLLPEEIQIHFYLINLEIEDLEGVPVMIHLRNRSKPYRELIEQYLSYVPEPGRVNPFPEGVRVLGVYFYERRLVIDLSRDVLINPKSYFVTPEVLDQTFGEIARKTLDADRLQQDCFFRVYGLMKTLFYGFSDMDRIQIIVNGKQVETILTKPVGPQTVSIFWPFTRDDIPQ